MANQLLESEQNDLLRQLELKHGTVKKVDPVSELISYINNTAQKKKE